MNCEATTTSHCPDLRGGNVLAVDLFQKMTKPRPNFDRPRPRRSDGPQEGMVAVLKQCGDDLTRENVLKQAANIHDLKLPMLLPGITVSTSAP